MDIDSFHTSLKTSLGQNLMNSLNIDLGSPLINTMVTSLILMLFNGFFFKIIDFFSSYTGKVKEFLKKYITFNKWNTITLQGTVSRTRQGDGRNFFSDRFITINNWIIDSLCEISGVRRIKEEDVRKLASHHNSWDDAVKTFILDEVVFRCIDRENDIWVKYSVEENNSENEEKDSKHSKMTKNITIQLRSKKLSVTNLKQLIDTKTRIFMDKIDEQNMDKSFYFEFIKSNIDEDWINFSEIRFETNRKISNVFFSQKPEFLEKFNFFINRRDWYDRLGIPYHLGILLYGLPGCGKTSLIKAIANETGYQIISIPLSRVKTAKELTSIFHAEKINRKNVPMSKRIYLFEDIDAMQVALKREIDEDDSSYSKSDTSSVASNDDLECEDINPKEVKSKSSDSNDILLKLIKSESSKISSAIKDDDPLTLSHILNLIDGLIEMPGRIIIFTTNHKSKLDPALIRPGRVDIAIEMKKASSEIIGDMYEWFFESKMMKEDIDKMPNEVFTPAEVSNIFYRFNNRPMDALEYLKTF